MTLPYGRDALRGRVAVVAGATRGAGRGIAAALGEAGATVVCTGRTSTQRKLKSDYDRPETIEETAELVTSLGGTGIAIPIDHLVPDDVKGLAERLQNQFGKIDILVNDIWGAEILKGGPPQWNTPVWELDLDKGLRILRLAIDTHIITSKYLLPLLISPVLTSNEVRPSGCWSKLLTGRLNTTRPIIEFPSITIWLKRLSTGLLSRKDTNSRLLEPRQ
jgi:NAD(P)-dependent dehydrogenase (short-subunit alcohol dehydrogenase family)